MDKKLTEARLQEIKRGAQDQLIWYFRDAERVVYHLNTLELMELLELAEKEMKNEAVRSADVL